VRRIGTPLTGVGHLARDDAEVEAAQVHEEVDHLPVPIWAQRASMTRPFTLRGFRKTLVQCLRGP
jgi:hypothetical protein